MILKIVNLENALSVVLFCLPTYLLKVRIFSIPSNVLEIAILSIFIGWFLVGKNIQSVRVRYLKYKKIILALSLIFSGIVLSAYLNGSTLISWGIVKSWFFVPLVFLFLLFEIITKDKIQKIFCVLFSSSFVVALISLGYLLIEKTTYDGRLMAFFNSPNYLAMYLAPAIIIAIFQEKQKKYAIFRTVALAVILFAFYFTYSYAAWLAVACSVCLVFAIKQKKIFKKKYLPVLFFCLLFIGFQLKSDKFNDLINFDSRSSLASRIMIWKASQRMIENNLFLGIGAGNFQETYLEYQKFYPPYLEWAVPHPHNLYLSFWLYGGIMSFFGFIMLIFLYFKEIFELIKKENNNVFFVSLGIILVILIHGFFDTTYFKNDLALIFWLSFIVLKEK